MKGDRIVIEVPPHLKALADAFSNLLGKVAATTKPNVGGRAVAYEEIEVDYGEAAAAVERAAHEATLASLDVDVPMITVGGVLHRRLFRHEGTYYTMAGEVRVLRTIYRRSGIRNAEVLDPISRKVGAIGNGWLPKAARGIAYLMQQGSEREVENTGRKLGRLRYCASTFKRVGHEMGRLYRDHRADIEDQLIEE